MSSQVNNVVITMLFADGFSRNYTFEGVADADLDSVKSKIQAINANANNEYENFYKTFVSSDGEPVTSISAAKIVTVSEEVIYSG